MFAGCGKPFFGSMFLERSGEPLNSLSTKLLQARANAFGVSSLGPPTPNFAWLRDGQLAATAVGSQGLEPRQNRDAPKHESWPSFWLLCVWFPGPSLTNLQKPQPPTLPNTGGFSFRNLHRSKPQQILEGRCSKRSTSFRARLACRFGREHDHVAMVNKYHSAIWPSLRQVPLSG